MIGGEPMDCPFVYFGERDGLRLEFFDGSFGFLIFDFGDDLAKVTGMLSVECFGEGFGELGLRRVGGEHFCPGDRLEEQPMSAADLGEGDEHQHEAEAEKTGTHGG